jgi:hypothetical protein
MTHILLNIIIIQTQALIYCVQARAQVCSIIQGLSQHFLDAHDKNSINNNSSSDINNRVYISYNNFYYENIERYKNNGFYTSYTLQYSIASS